MLIANIRNNQAHSNFYSSFTWTKLLRLNFMLNSHVNACALHLALFTLAFTTEFRNTLTLCYVNSIEEWKNCENELIVFKYRYPVYPKQLQLLTIL